MAAVNRHWRRDSVRYVCCTLPFAVYPIVFLAVARRVFRGETLTHTDLVADGGILTIAITLAFDSLLRLMASNRRWNEFKTVLLSLAAWAMGLGSFFYAFRWYSRTTTSVVFVDLCFLVLTISIVIAGF